MEKSNEKRPLSTAQEIMDNSFESRPASAAQEIMEKSSESFLTSHSLSCCQRHNANADAEKCV